MTFDAADSPTALPLAQVTPDRFAAGEATPAAVLSGEVPASQAAHPLSVFDMFRIGIGPSSSHTVGPMRAGLAFTGELASLLARDEGDEATSTPQRSPEEGAESKAPCRIMIDLFGSLGATGRGHNTDRAVLLGLAGYSPESVEIDTVEGIFPTIAATGFLPTPCGQVPFDIARDIRFVPRTVLKYHVNALTITAWREADGHEKILEHTYYSVGGGFVMVQTNDDVNNPQVASLATGMSAATIDAPAPFLFTTSARLLHECKQSGLRISELVRRNEEAVRTAQEVDEYLDAIADTMFECVDAGTSASGILPGGLDVPRRAKALSTKLSERARTGCESLPGAPWASSPNDPMRAMDWVNLFALAVNEENAAGHRIVTAPTNGAAGVIPAVLGYLVSYCPEAGATIGAASAPALFDSPEAPLARVRFGSKGVEVLSDASDIHGKAWARRRKTVHDFLLAATAVGSLIKTNASIAGAEVGCQGEVGSAAAMAAAGLAEALGGTPEQVENAAEIAMEHSLGLTCDPIAGLVQIPCIERNAIAAVKAINAARMALWSDGRHTVSLDAVIETMRQTGNDMLSKYKETSAGGLAVNVVEC